MTNLVRVTLILKRRSCMKCNPCITQRRHSPRKLHMSQGADTVCGHERWRQIRFRFWPTRSSSACKHRAPANLYVEHYKTCVLQVNRCGKNHVLLSNSEPIYLSWFYSRYCLRVLHALEGDSLTSRDSPSCPYQLLF